MSEKYGVEELIETINDVFGMANRSLEMKPRYQGLHDTSQNAIVAKLKELDQANKIIKEADRVISYLGLWDDHEFDALREELEKYEGI